MSKSLLIVYMVLPLGLFYAYFLGFLWRRWRGMVRHGR
jgi:hypothetical protein